MLKNKQGGADIERCSGGRQAASGEDSCISNTRRSRFAARSSYQHRYVSAPEILAPAGNKEAFVAAVNYGADAVYLGLNEFNARKKAENFTLQNLGYYIKYAHLFNVKVYLTVNTLILDNELNLLTDMIKSAVNLGIDAFIVQDLGVFFLIKKLFPDIDIHASTQMGICNLEGALFCERISINRVILARETPFEEIERITNNCKIETEVFVHGALCVSFSGQCFFSSSVFSKSGNRGECLQPCRKFYSVLKNNKKIAEGYMLSPSDLCLADYLKKLAEINVTAFKIEGRMRRSEYVAESVKTYKNILSGKTSFNLNPLKKLYNRGDYTCGYTFKDDVNSLMSKNVQGHKGLFIGKVIKIENDKLLIESNQPLSKGDGFKIFNESGLETGNGIYNSFVKNSIYSILYKGKVSLNDKVHITTDAEQIKKINEFKRTIKVDAEFTANLNEPAALRLMYGSITVEIKSDENSVQALDKPVDYDTVFNALNKLKETPFELNSLNFHAQNVFIPLSKLNALKKAAFMLLENKLLEKNNFNKTCKLNENDIEFIKTDIKPVNIAVTDDFKVDDKLFDYLVFKPKVYSIENTGNFLKMYSQFENKFLYLPPVLSKEDILLINKISGSFKGFYINNPGHLEMGFIAGKKTIIGEGFNIFNKYALKFISGFNPEAVVLSKELNIQSLNFITGYSGIPVSALVYGETESMQLRHCVVKNIFNNDCKNCKYSSGLVYEDEKKQRFKIYRRKLSDCYFVLLNSKKLNALKNLKREKFGFTFDFSFDDNEEAILAQNYYIDKFVKQLNPDFNFTNFTNGNLIKGV